jgi:hypothetical protein
MSGYAAAVERLHGVSADRPNRTVTWTFRRGDETLLCALGLDSKHSQYELITDVPWSGHPSVERFEDVHAAIQRQAAVERLLVEEGWSLERFDATPTAE